MDIIIPAIIGCIIGVCITAILHNNKKVLEVGQENDNGFWYTLTFVDPELGFRNIIIMFAKRYLNAMAIAAAREKAGASKDAVLLSVTYIGQQTIEDFTCDTKEVSE